MISIKKYLPLLIYFHITWVKLLYRTTGHKESEKKRIRYIVKKEKKRIGNLQYIIITRGTTNNLSSRVLLMAYLFPHYMG